MWKTRDWKGLKYCARPQQTLLPSAQPSCSWAGSQGWATAGDLITSRFLEDEKCPKASILCREKHLLPLRRVESSPSSKKLGVYFCRTNSHTVPPIIRGVQKCFYFLWTASSRPSTFPVNTLGKILWSHNYCYSQVKAHFDTWSKMQISVTLVKNIICQYYNLFGASFGNPCLFPCILVTAFTFLKLLYGPCSDHQGTPDLGEYRADNPWPVNCEFPTSWGALEKNFSCQKSWQTVAIVWKSQCCSSRWLIYQASQSGFSFGCWL